MSRNTKGRSRANKNGLSISICRKTGRTNTETLACSKRLCQGFAAWSNCHEHLQGHHGKDYQSLGYVKKGESASPIVFWKPWQVEDRKDGEIRVKDVAILRYYSVYNADQIEGIDFPCPAKKEYSFSPIESGEKVIAEMPNKPVMREGNNAYYIPSQDAVYMPRKERFELPQHYYSTAFHELVHSTGHENRLKRKGIEKCHGFGSHEYSKEELIAEFGASYICGHCGIEIKETFDNSVSYIKGWIRKIKSNPKWLVFAAAQAQKAADYILNAERQERKSSVLHLILN